MDKPERKKTFDLTKVTTEASFSNQDQVLSDEKEPPKLSTDSQNQLNITNLEDPHKEISDPAKLPTDSSSLTHIEKSFQRDQLITIEGQPSSPIESVNDPDSIKTSLTETISTVNTVNTHASDFDNPILPKTETSDSQRGTTSSKLLQKARSSFFVLIGVGLMLFGISGLIIEFNKDNNHSLRDPFTGVSLGAILLFSGYRAFRYRNAAKQNPIVNLTHLKLLISYLFIISGVPIFFSGIGSLLDGSKDKTWGNVFAGFMIILVGVLISRKIFFKINKRY